jgi:hypothetical protein
MFNGCLGIDFIADVLWNDAQICFGTRQCGLRFLQAFDLVLRGENFADDFTFPQFTFGNKYGH